MEKLIFCLLFITSITQAECLQQKANSSGINYSKAFDIKDCEHTKEIVDTYKKMIIKETYDHENDFEDFSYDYIDYNELKVTLRDNTETRFSQHEFSFVKDYYRDFSNRDIIKITYVDSHKSDKYTTYHILLINKDETEIIAIKKELDLN